MEQVGITKEIDNLGRIVIPKSLSYMSIGEEKIYIFYDDYA